MDIVNGQWYLLTGCDDTGEGITFTLDGVTFRVHEDESDEYRSYGVGPYETAGKCSNTFGGQAVIAIIRADDAFDGVELVNPDGGAVIVQAGTDVSDDYYPMARWSFSPQNLTANRGRE